MKISSLGLEHEKDNEFPQISLNLFNSRIGSSSPISLFNENKSPNRPNLFDFESDLSFSDLKTESTSSSTSFRQKNEEKPLFKLFRKEEPLKAPIRDFAGEETDFLRTRKENQRQSSQAQKSQAASPDKKTSHDHNDHDQLLYQFKEFSHSKPQFLSFKKSSISANQTHSCKDLKRIMSHNIGDIQLIETRQKAVLPFKNHTKHDQIKTVAPELVLFPFESVADSSVQFEFEFSVRFMRN